MRTYIQKVSGRTGILFAAFAVALGIFYVLKGNASVLKTWAYSAQDKKINKSNLSEISCVPKDEKESIFFITCGGVY